MSKQQQLELDAILRQGQLDVGADVPTLRAGFNDVMARVPVAGDVHQKPTTIGGVGANSGRRPTCITPTTSWSWNLEGLPSSHNREVVVHRTVHEAPVGRN